MKSYNLDAVGMVIIEDLKILKKKFEKAEKRLFNYGLINIVIAMLFLVYLSVFTFIPYWNQYNSIITNMINNPYHYLFIAVMVTVYQRLKVLKKKADKAEKEYDDLRCEIIQRLEELWPRDYGWEQRHLFLKDMRDNYDINLYYEN